jgi:hypothetical protein
VARGVQVRPRLVNLAVDREGWAVDGRLCAFRLYFTLLIDENKITDADLRKVRAERIDPKVLGIEGITES